MNPTWLSYTTSVAVLLPRLTRRGVAHRDLKLENLLLAAPGDISAIKIADFGLAKKATRADGVLDTICGTPQYVAPEVIAVRCFNVALPRLKRQLGTSHGLMDIVCVSQYTAETCAAQRGPLPSNC